eukprot:CAMPEP_0174267184 /NCGR_PEP_ID=MMETSP0439-20130205/32762_1 /TAXON_ID=0 /ORGANISM="Stereomyxa ramosa, Strain Chinc5" /LENGTH=149 /DNA_ID=CAMNT_0015354543 /DNA_START=190 /DNA_END=639 /DNA_ORIENTATION=+
MVFNAQIREARFDARTGKLVMKIVGLFGTKRDEFWLYEIQDVVIEELRDSQGGEDIRLFVNLRSGERLPLLESHMTGICTDLKHEAQKNILNFLEETFSSAYFFPKDLEMQSEGEAKANKSSPMVKRQLQFSDTEVSAEDIVTSELSDA